ncbi:actin cortical patch SUR7/pH-response regulator pali [Zychaea mexicana]|uniref:actin cortical patch SUR7/pH-response regulator pali n=1 Tax=Zychaea mexicana TaxID=64656 RepID=UPI0022FE9BFB|nr:actin cortical patch SUR7/pH-response regulator pali [Zychaea mexicana]KAI9492920.1 actin cortical patch SUR7/pH-response regulator pali [Zychaea mexicana]
MLAFLATFFDFAALVLQIFTLLGSTYNREFLRDLYFARLEFDNQFVDFGLWTYCSGQNGEVSDCSNPEPAFDWTTAGEEDARYSAIREAINLDGLHQVFLANFILYWIALGLTLFAMIITFVSGFRRGSDFLASFLTFVAALVMIVVFIILMVVSMRGINNAKDAGVDATGHLGPSMWMTLGAMIALLLSSFWYCLTCCFGSGRRIQNEEKA